MLRSCFAFLLFLGIAGAATAASPDPKSLTIPADELARARELVQQLGSEQFAEREKAEIELAKMGRLARPALVEGANTDPSQEVRARCSSLLPKAVSLDIKARLDVFLADADGKFEHDLPGWNQFRATLRNEWHLFGHQVWSDRSLDRAARVVFADLISTAINRQVILAAGGAQSDLGQIVAARRQELYNQKYPRAVVVGGMIIQPTVVRRDPTAEDIASLPFAESHVQSRFVPRTSAISALITASGFVAAVLRESDDRAKVYQAIAGAWLESRRDPLDMYQAMTIATQLGMPDQTVRLSARLLTTPGTTVNYRGMAATNLARLGTKEHIPLLEKALTDQAVLSTVRENLLNVPIAERPTHDIQIRDVALALSLLLSDQKLEDYGFVELNKANGLKATAANYSYARYYLPEADRKTAFEKWKEWQAAEEKGKK